MIPDYLKNWIIDEDFKFKGENLEFFVLPAYNPETHYLELTRSGYFRALLGLRHYI